jgi:hypothetical protein
VASGVGRSDLNFPRDPCHPIPAAAMYGADRRGEAVEGWERREDVIRWIAQLQPDFGSSESLVLVSHGLLLTTCLDHEIGLNDPSSFWSNLRMPDAWVADFEDKWLGGSLPVK